MTDLASRIRALDAAIAHLQQDIPRMRRELEAIALEIQRFEESRSVPSPQAPESPSKDPFQQEPLSA